MTIPETEQRAVIFDLQTWLRTIANYDISIPLIYPDGIYGPETQNAVAVFQGKNGLSVTGKADLTTWECIHEAYLDIINETARPLKLDLFQPQYLENGRIQKGDEFTQIYMIQVMLEMLSLHFEDMGEIIIDGIFDDNTEHAVKSFQRSLHINDTGYIDKETWQHMSRSYNKFSRESARQ